MAQPEPPAFALGILVDAPPPRPGRSLAQWPEHTHAHLCTERHLPGVRACLLPANGVAPGKESAAAWWYEPRSATWENATIPLPGALYNRIGRRRSERAAGRLLRRLAGVRPLFNRRFLEKDALYDLLRAGAYPHLPDYHVLGPDLDAALAFYDRHGDVYIKPADGSLGSGIRRLRRLAGERHLLTANGTRAAREAPVTRALPTARLPALFRRLQRPGAPRVVLQESVPLLAWKGRPFDLRVLVQKDAAGRWRLTGAAGRAAPPGGITTHTLRGGAAVGLDQLARALGDALPSTDRIAQAATDACRLIEAELDGGLFELSFDFGVDREGRLVLLEANAKPFPFDEPAIRTAAGRNVLNFAVAVARDPTLLRPGRQPAEPDQAPAARNAPQQKVTASADRMSAKGVATGCAP